jgi:hypothetical protein
MDWCRLWHDAPDDPKWRLIARKANVRVGDVWAVWTRMMVRASASTERGSITGWDDEVEAVALDFEPDAVAAIRESMQGRVLDGDKLAGWSKRQPKRERAEDDSSERVRAHRERQKAQETANLDDVTPCNATQRTETPRLDEIRLEKKEKTPARKRAGYDSDFEDWWKVYPHKVGKDAAAKAYHKALTRTDSQTLLAKAQAFAAEQSGKDPQYIAHPATWLNQGRWMDEPAKPKTEHVSGVPPARREVTPAEWETRVRKFKTNGFWLSSFGPRPDAMSTQVPKPVLKALGYVHEPV